ncbi:MAG: 16S rRNA (uracil(1498)-N(3))-methyltransferase [Cytophagales bacterium]|nr:16S rRNA (uracil(1498)-N(3))-methyltransferase [Cytophagales bacterium]
MTNKMPRFYCPTALAIGSPFDLPSGAARHVQVLRMQPAMTITLFDGLGGEYEAVIQNMGRTTVTVQVTSHNPIEREAAPAVHLALGVPANERMDWLVEKATELGVASIQPLMTERGVLRLAGERATKKQAHWQAIASSASEQSGRNRVPSIHAIKTLSAYLEAQAKTSPRTASATHKRFVLSLAEGSVPLPQALSSKACSHKDEFFVLSGAEGGLSPAEEHKAFAAGYQAVSLGNRVLRAETAAIAALTALTLMIV